MKHSSAKRSVAVLCFLLAAWTSSRAQPLLANKRVLWLGDSITQMGDYVTFVDYFLEKKYPADRFDVISIGLGSETTSCLSEKTHPFPRPCVQERLKRALDLVKPQVVVACYGMNDGIYHPQSAERMKAFEQGIEKLIAAVHAAGAEMVLLTPPPFDVLPVKDKVVPKSASDFGFMAPYAGYDDVLTGYARWEMQLPKNQATVIDLHAPMDAYLAKQRKTDPDFSFAKKDGIHPDIAGHLLMAQIVLRGLGIPFASGNLQAELKTVEADPLFALIKEQREVRSAGWLKYVGYTRGETVKVDSVADVEKQNTELQAEIDALRRG
ncbi:SGNH/GDSL hydrolase family protein [Alloacidobacterium sp.]|uniref:SGNH/GDSL hydrolase family protein n=1 Tax=Alloacidobacterium sp. TaxID=2951999 RepID=UPI002D4924B3|nr:SGNH/GDSL hydrolase family protein [Alloacidobacterium sp.]HYK36113.1 SGNH/GDSL hydrolase family protein [Alloacidobacterium sp.]